MALGDDEVAQNTKDLWTNGTQAFRLLLLKDSDGL